MIGSVVVCFIKLFVISQCIQKETVLIRALIIPDEPFNSNYQDPYYAPTNMGYNGDDNNAQNQ